MITWTLEEAEADFILALLNGQQAAPLTVMQRAGLIQKLVEQGQKKGAGVFTAGGTDD